jgi:sulfite reductase (NADPH) flavoprotein alpha-component
LWWSYDFYRNALNSMAGVNGSLRPRAAAVAPGTAVQDSWDRLWQSFRAQVPDATAASLSLDGAAGKPVELRYQTPHSAHERAWDALRIDPSNGKVLARQPYAELPRGRRFIGALFPLHSGGFFGEPGRILMAIASLLMPFFTVTGIWLWIARRRAEASRRRAATVVADVETAG